MSISAHANPQAPFGLVAPPAHALLKSATRSKLSEATVAALRMLNLQPSCRRAGHSSELLARVLSYPFAQPPGAALCDARQPEQ